MEYKHQNARLQKKKIIFKDLGHFSKWSAWVPSYLYVTREGKVGESCTETQGCHARLYQWSTKKDALKKMEKKR